MGEFIKKKFYSVAISSLVNSVSDRSNIMLDSSYLQPGDELTPNLKRGKSWPLSLNRVWDDSHPPNDLYSRSMSCLFKNLENPCQFKNLENLSHQIWNDILFVTYRLKEIHITRGDNSACHTIPSFEKIRHIYKCCENWYFCWKCYYIVYYQRFLHICFFNFQLKFFLLHVSLTGNNNETRLD